jgi:hypothetical protein
MTTLPSKQNKIQYAPKGIGVSSGFFNEIGLSPWEIKSIPWLFENHEPCPIPFQA